MNIIDVMFHLYRDTAGLLKDVSTIMRSRMIDFLTNTRCYVLKACYLEILQQVLSNWSHDETSHDLIFGQMKKLLQWLTGSLTALTTQVT